MATKFSIDDEENPTSPTWGDNPAQKKITVATGFIGGGKPSERYDMLDEDEDYFDPTLPIWKHPKVRKNPRTIGAALFLLFTGIVFFFISISLFSASDNSRAVVFIVVSALTLIPGGYITFYIWMTLKGEPGYYFSAIPNFDS